MERAAVVRADNKDKGGNMLKPYLVAAVLLATAGAANAQNTQQEIERYRQMIADGNPAELYEAKGEGIWKQKRGPKQVSLEQCDLGLGAGVVKGVYAQLPRYFKDADRVMDLETRLVHCMVSLQGISEADAKRNPFSTADRTSDMESLVSFVTAESKGVKMNVSLSHQKEREMYQLGEKMFYFRGGPYDFSCATCHGEDAKRIRLQDLPNLTNAKDAQRAYTTWPAYRVSQSTVRTFQWRLFDCFRQQRFPALEFTSDASVALTTFLAKNANGGTLAAPALKR